MVVGGNDVLLKSAVQPHVAIDMARRLFKDLNPLAVFEDSPGSLFCYVTKDSKDEWDTGKTPKNTMVQIIPADGNVTVVLDDLDYWQGFTSALRGLLLNFMFGWEEKKIGV